MKKVLIFSGGRGSTNLIKSISSLNKSLQISSIINLYDDGKSSGMIRFIFNMPGPSDARKVQEIFLKNSKLSTKYQRALFKLRISTSYLNFLKEINNFNLKKSKKIFEINVSNIKFRNQLIKYLKTFINVLNQRFINTSDISFINLIYVGAFYNYKKDINKTITAISKLFSIKNEVISCGYKNLYLSGINNNNKIFYNEEAIVEQRSNTNMKNIYLSKQKFDKKFFMNKSNYEKIQIIKKLSVRDKISKEALKLIKSADIIIYSPGTPHSSLYPTYFVKGVGDAVSKNKKAKKIMITNIGSDYETPKFSANDYIKKTLKFLKIDKKIHDNDLISHLLINKPIIKKSFYVKPNVDKKYLKSFTSYFGNFELQNHQGVHCPIKMKKILNKII